jgi:hypothetical protein
MTTDLERLARANPVPEPYDADPDAADELLRRVLLDAPPVVPRRLRRWRRRGLIVAVAAVAAAFWVLGPTGGSPDPVQRLAGAQKAYAAVLPGDDVIHEVVSSAWSVGGVPRGHESYEAWYRPSTGEAVRVTGGDEGSVRVMITRDGTVLVDSTDTHRIYGGTGLIPMTSSATAGFRARNRQDFAAAFRAAYSANQLADRGLTTFAGRPAERFEVVAGLDGIDGLDWYADPRTGHPLGSVERIGNQTNVRRLTTWERLKPTPSALAKLDIRR